MCMDVIFIDVVLCELATDHRTSLVYTEDLTVNPGSDSRPLAAKVANGLDTQWSISLSKKEKRSLYYLMCVHHPWHVDVGLFSSDSFRRSFSFSLGY